MYNLFPLHTLRSAPEPAAAPLNPISRTLFSMRIWPARAQTYLAAVLPGFLYGFYSAFRKSVYTQKKTRYEPGFLLCIRAIMNNVHVFQLTHSVNPAPEHP